MIKKKLKKGDIFQVVIALIMLFFIAIFGLLAGTLSYKVAEFYKTSDFLEAGSEGAEANQLIQDFSIPMLDFFVFLFFLGSNIALVISAIRTDFSPTMVWIFIMLIMIEVLIASGFVNLYQGFREEAALAPVPDKMILTNIIFSQYTPLIFGIIGAMVLIIMYGKSGGDIIP